MLNENVRRGVVAVGGIALGLILLIEPIIGVAVALIVLLRLDSFSNPER